MPLEPRGSDEPTDTIRRRLGPGATVLAAAMAGLAQVLEPEKVTVTIEQPGDQPLDDDPLADVTFGGLPPLDLS